MSIETTEIGLKYNALEMGNVLALSDYFAHNRTADNFQLSYDGDFCGPFLTELSRGVSMNPIIVDLTVGEEWNDHSTLVISNTIRRNKAALNYALGFVFRCGTDHGALRHSSFSPKHLASLRT